MHRYEHTFNHFYFFFYMIPHNPKSTLFPYTTLFRSVATTMTSQDVIHSFFVPAFRVKQDVVPGKYTGNAGDRKSTRLNSSHVEISYAVFCLKKKNISYRDSTTFEHHAHAFNWDKGY